MRLITFGGVIAYRALFNWTSPAMFTGTLLAGPVFQLLFFAYLGRQLGVADDSFYILGNAVNAAAISCLFGGVMAVVNERRYGTLGHVLLSPRSRTATFLGRALPYAGNGVIISAFTLAVGSLLLGLHVPVASWPGLVIVIAVSSLGSGFFGLLLGAFALRIRDVWLISNVSVTLMILLTGANVPREGLPAWMQTVGSALPLTHGIEAARKLVAGSSITDVAGLIGTEALIGTACAAIAAVLLKVFEYESRRTASLDTL